MDCSQVEFCGFWLDRAIMVVVFGVINHFDETEWWFLLEVVGWVITFLMTAKSMYILFSPHNDFSDEETSGAQSWWIF